MSCGLVLAVTLAFTPAAADAGSTAAPAPATAPASAPASVAAEPFYADIIRRAQTLEAAVARYRTDALKASATAIPLAGFADLKREALALAELDMQGHRDLAARGTDGDLKCILRGISEDMPLRLEGIETATSGAAQDVALAELQHLLEDNAQVLLSPPNPPV